MDKMGNSPQYIDRIYIYALKNLALDTILVPSIALCDFSNKDVRVVIENTSGSRIDFSNTPTSINLEVRHGALPPNNYPFPLSGDIGGFSKDTFTITNMSFGTGTYYLRAWLTVPVDNDPSDDTTRRTLEINPDISIRGIPNTDIPASNCIPRDYRVSQEVVITNSGNFDVYDVPISVETHGVYGLIDSIPDILPGLLQAGTSRNWIIQGTYKVPSEMRYGVIVRASLSCDAYPADNSNSFQECADLEDIEPVEIVTPFLTDHKVGEEVALGVRIKNWSPLNSFTNVDLFAVISGVGFTPIQLYGIVSSINPNDITLYEFTTKYTVPTVDKYSIKVFVSSVDINPSNDTLEVQYTTNLGAIDYKVGVFELCQNIPNPARDNTRIGYSLPADGQVLFTVYTVVGQVLHVERRDAYLGRNEIEFNTLNLADGVYYYSMEYKGERLVKKMTIRK
jgi:hypothetical protein